MKTLLLLLLFLVCLAAAPPPAPFLSYDCGLASAAHSVPDQAGRGGALEPSGPAPRCSALMGCLLDFQTAYSATGFSLPSEAYSVLLWLRLSTWRGAFKLRLDAVGLPAHIVRPSASCWTSSKSRRPTPATSCATGLLSRCLWMHLAGCWSQ